MRWMKSIAREIYGLFVDDGSFAGAILIWLGLAMAGVPRAASNARWAGPALFAGLALILIESVLRFARRRTK
jgi:membrane protein implicated in regulation of membrane protease activity